MKSVVVTICSSKKNHEKGFLSARERYLGDHIILASKAASETKKELYILSGLYGLISADAEIPDYDYLLEQDVVEALIHKVVKQLKAEDIGEIIFYTKPSWESYSQVMKESSKTMKVKLKFVELS